MPFSSVFWCVVRVAQCNYQGGMLKNRICVEDSMLRSAFLTPKPVKFLQILLHKVPHIFMCRPSEYRVVVGIELFTVTE